MWQLYVAVAVTLILLVVTSVLWFTIGDGKSSGVRPVLMYVPSGIKADTFSAGSKVQGWAANKASSYIRSASGGSTGDAAAKVELAPTNASSLQPVLSAALTNGVYAVTSGSSNQMQMRTPLTEVFQHPAFSSSSNPLTACTVAWLVSGGSPAGISFESEDKSTLISFASTTSTNGTTFALTVSSATINIARQEFLSPPVNAKVPYWVYVECRGTKVRFYVRTTGGSSRTLDNVFELGTELPLPDTPFMNVNASTQSTGDSNIYAVLLCPAGNIKPAMDAISKDFVLASTPASADTVLDVTSSGSDRSNRIVAAIIVSAVSGIVIIAIWAAFGKAIAEKYPVRYQSP